jgi:hypothetical protein
MFFELHLVRSGVIRPDQLVDALLLQNERRPKIGELACKFRKLTVKQVFSVLQAQVDDQTPFGEMAVRMGFLTKRKVSYLLRKQREMTPSLSDCLLEIGAIDQPSVDRELTKFRRGSLDPDQTPLVIEAMPRDQVLVAGAYPSAC